MLSRRQRRSPILAFQLTLVVAASALLGCGPEADAKKTTVAKPVINQPALLAQQRFDAGKQLAAENDHKRAVEEFTKALEVVGTAAGPAQVESPDAEIFYQRGLAFLEMNQPDTAAEDFTAVIAVRPKFGPAYAKRGRAHCEVGDLYRAVRDCTTAIRLDPTNAESHRYRGVAYMRRAQYERAIVDLERAIELDATLKPDLDKVQAEAFRRWSRALVADGDHAAANEKLAVARQLDPTYVEPPPPTEVEKPVVEPLDSVQQTAARPELAEAYPHFEKGRELQAQGKHHEALIEFTTAITLDREYFDAYLRRGESLLALKFPDTAIEDFNEAVRLHDRSSEAYRLQAKAFIGLNQHYRAAMSATDALHVNPADAQAYAIRGEAYAALRNWDRSIADYEEAGRLDPILKSQLAPAVAEVYRVRDAEEKERREHAAADAAMGRDL